jgi:hypothetical protein
VWIGTLNEIFLVKSSYRLEKERSIQEKKKKEAVCRREFEK